MLIAGFIDQTDTKYYKMPSSSNLRAFPIKNSVSIAAQKLFVELR